MTGRRYLDGACSSRCFTAWQCSPRHAAADDDRHRRQVTTVCTTRVRRRRRGRRRCSRAADLGISRLLPAARSWQGFMDEQPEHQRHVSGRVERRHPAAAATHAGRRPAMPDVIQDDTFLIEAYQNAGCCRSHRAEGPWEQRDPDAYNEILPIAWDENRSGHRRHLRRLRSPPTST